MAPKILQNDPGISVKHIIHISDTHIRQGDTERSRYEEYDHVFKNLIRNITTSDAVDIRANNILFVITGDVFHNKGKVDTPAIKLFFRWMDKMLNIAPVIMICGNHDFRQEDPLYPDMIEAFTMPYIDSSEGGRRVKYPLFYLKETGHYIYQNIGFGLVSVKDTLRTFNTAGIQATLPDFPSVKEFDSCGVDFKLALFHGTLLPYDTDELKNIHGYRLEWFEGYNAVLLGDNHVQQVHRSKMKTGTEIIWGYPGSLIQQNFAESPFHHGYILWTLDTKKINAECYHVFNNYGMLTLKKGEGDGTYNLIMGKTRQDVVDLKDMIVKDVFPKKPKIRIIGTNEEEKTIETLISTLNSDITPQSYVANIPVNANDDSLDETNNSIKELIHQMGTINDREKWIEFLEKTRTEESGVEYMMIGFINEPELMRIDIETDELSKDIVQKIKTRNEKIQRALQEYADVHAQHHGENHKIILKHMKWDYVMCYGPNNYFNFETSENKICLLNGRNAVGKTAFLDVICIGLYGEPSKQRKMLSGKKMGGKMLHDHRPENVSMSVNLLFTLNGEYYEVYRSFSKQGRGDAGKEDLRQMNAVISTVNIQTKVKTIICEGVVTVDGWIEKKFGTIDDILMSTFVSQTETNNFFHLKQEDQKAIYDKAVHLESIAAFGQVLKESLLAHNDILTMINNSKSALGELIQSKATKKNGVAKDLGISLQSQIDKYTSESSILEEGYKKYAQAVGDFEPEGACDAGTIKKLLEKNIKKLEKLGTITEEDKKKTLRIEGEQKANYMALIEEKTAIGEPTMEDISLQKIGEMVDEIGAQYTKHMETKPACNLSPETLKKQLADLNKWTSIQKNEWLENPDGLETYLNEAVQVQKVADEKYRLCVQNPAQRPMPGAKINKRFLESQKKWTQKDLTRLKSEYSDLQAKWSELIKISRVKPRSLDPYKTWLADYKIWTTKIEPVRDLDESLEDYRKRYNDYMGYIATIRNKMDSQTQYNQGLEQIHEQLEELNVANLPFNPDCWACKALPTRERHNDLCNKKGSLVKEIQKIVKYLKKLPGGFDLEAEQATLYEMEENIQTREYYEKTVDRMTTEKAEWEQVHEDWNVWNTAQETEASLSSEIADYTVKIATLEQYLWDSWQKKESDLKKACEEGRADIEHAKQFMKEYEDYVERQRFLEEETALQAKYEEWDRVATNLSTKHAEYKLELRRKLLDEKFTKWQSENNMRVDLVEKIRTFENLEKAIQQGERTLKYIEMQKIAEQKSGIDKKLREVSHELVRYQKEEEDNKTLMGNIAIYEKYATLLARRKEALGMLECRFIGEKNGNEGYKEYIYKNHVIPLIEKEINQFLSLIDPLRLQITYADKSFQYMVQDRGNTPTLAMCSGYQKFIIGIALRLALSRIGATGQNIRHFFIDEGFVACDAFNLEKVQSMLRKMMEYGEYVNIILMSHLEAIRDAADMSVDIIREGYFSKIHWGSIYPTLSKATGEGNEPKKAGRPAKSAKSTAT